MRLAIDIGNTAVKAALELGSGEIHYETLTGPEGLARLKDFGAVEFTAVSSVVPARNPEYLAVLKAHGRPFRLLDASNAPGLRIQYETPETVGADRLANALYLTRGPLPAILVDFGTATKLDVVDSAGAFLGGAILPGVAMMVQSLAEGTAKLPSIVLEAPRHAIGRNTRDCLLSGTVLALAKAVDGLIEAFTEELGHRPSVVSTGGAAEVVAPLTAFAHAVEPHATLLGLLEAAGRWIEAA